MNEIYFISDLHFYHKAMIKFHPHTRGHFKDVDEMNEKIIENWNSVVKANDTVYLLGDVSFSSGKKTKELISRLKGKITLIKGNHDKMKDVRKYQHLLEDVLTYHEIKYFYNNKNYHFVLFHYPIALWNRKHFGSIHIHGHSHGNYKTDGKIYDVGIDSDVTDFKPISIKEIIKLSEND